jgi:hypothetical protein
MNQQQNNDKIILFHNTSDNQRAPLFTGIVTIDGKEFRASLWKATEKDGTPKLDKNFKEYFNGKIEPK